MTQSDRYGIYVYLKKTRPKAFGFMAARKGNTCIKAMPH